MGTPKVLVGGSTASASQLKDFFRQLEDGSLNGIHLQAFLDHRNPFGLDGVVLNWVKVYEALGMEPDFSHIVIPNDHPSFWDIYVLKGVTPNKVIKAFRDLGVDVSLYTENLDKDVPTNDRDPNKNGDYTVRFKKTIEADPDLAEKSADMLKQEDIKGITLLERLLLDLGYFLATGNHLDIENVTLCSGSRRSGGDVPSVNWYTDYRGLCVSWCYPDSRYSDLRSRAVQQ